MWIRLVTCKIYFNYIIFFEIVFRLFEEKKIFRLLEKVFRLFGKKILRLLEIVFRLFGKKNITFIRKLFFSLLIRKNILIFLL